MIDAVGLTEMSVRNLFPLIGMEYRDQRMEEADDSIKE